MGELASACDFRVTIDKGEMALILPLSSNLR
jgi:hypothetical protein